MQDVTRLLITRKNGESFLLDDHTKVTLHRPRRENRAELEITRDGESRRVPIGNREPCQVADNVSVELIFDHGRGGDRVRVMVLAPKSVKILRSELISVEKGK